MNDTPLFDSSIVTIACISDTHNEDPEILLPDADIFVHAGDLTDEGTPEELTAAYNWIASLPHKVKVIVPGNNDRSLCPRHPNYDAQSVALFASEENWSSNYGVRYLCDRVCTIAHYRSSTGAVKPLNVYGNPGQPDYLAGLGAAFANPFGFTYMPYPDSTSHAAWANAPTRVTPETEHDTDAAQIWITHSPPKGRLDAAPVDFHPQTKQEVSITGCELLMRKIAQTRPLVHVFGHLHGGCGVEKVTWKQEEHAVESTEVLALQNNDVGRAGVRKYQDFASKIPFGPRDSILVNAAWVPVDRKTNPKRNLPWLIRVDLDAQRG